MKLYDSHDMSVVVVVIVDQLNNSCWTIFVQIRSKLSPIFLWILTVIIISTWCIACRRWCRPVTTLRISIRSITSWWRRSTVTTLRILISWRLLITRMMTVITRFDWIKKCHNVQFVYGNGINEWIHTFVSAMDYDSCCVVVDVLELVADYTMDILVHMDESEVLVRICHVSVLVFPLVVLFSMLELVHLESFQTE